MQHSVIENSFPWGLPLKETLLPQFLAKGANNNFENYLIGKWHLGSPAWEYVPTSRGFDYFFGFYGPNEDHFEHSNRHRNAQGYDLRKQTTPIHRKGEYSTFMYTKEAKEILSLWASKHEKEDRPPSPLSNSNSSSFSPNAKATNFFLFLSYNAPHFPLQAPTEEILPFGTQKK